MTHALDTIGQLSPSFMEVPVQQLGKTAVDIATGINERISTVDRVALGSAFAVAMLSVVMFELSGQPVPAPTTVAWSPCSALPVSKLLHRAFFAPTRGKECARGSVGLLPGRTGRCKGKCIERRESE